MLPQAAVVSPIRAIRSAMEITVLCRIVSSRQEHTHSLEDVCLRKHRCECAPCRQSSILPGSRFLAVIHADEAGHQQRHIERPDDRFQRRPDLSEGVHRSDIAIAQRRQRG